LSAEFSDISNNEIDTFYATVSHNVKKKRIAMELSQLDLSLKLGIKSVAFYSNCENLRYGKHFNLEHIYKLAKALNIKMCDLLEENHHQ